MSCGKITVKQLCLQIASIQKSGHSCSLFSVPIIHLSSEYSVQKIAVIHVNCNGKILSTFFFHWLNWKHFTGGLVSSSCNSNLENFK